MPHQPLFKKISDLIARNRIAEAFSGLDEAPLPLDMTVDLVLLKNRWTENERGNMLRILTYDAYSVERARLVAALLQFAAGAPTPDAPQDIALRNQVDLEKIIGQSTLTRMAWFAQMVEASKSVCRVVVDGPGGRNWVGTGFLAENGYLFTNHHVLSGPEDARYATLDFNYLTETSRRTTYGLDHSTWTGDKDLDFARVKVVDNPEEPLSQWGFLQIDDRSVISEGDAVPIIQHPEGREKQVSIEGNFVRRLSADGKYLFYTTDTLPGSSGSPVFNKDWKVIALHHASVSDEDTNRGVLFGRIMGVLGGSTNQ